LRNGRHSATGWRRGDRSVEPAQNACGNPGRPIAILIKQSRFTRCQIGIRGEARIGDGLIAVVPLQSVPGAEPQKALMVLKDLVDRFQRNSIRTREAFEPDRGRNGTATRQDAQDRQQQRWNSSEADHCLFTRALNPEERGSVLLDLLRYIFISQGVAGIHDRITFEESKRQEN